MSIPLSALIGLVLHRRLFLAAIFAPWIAPYGMAEIVGGTWEPWSATHLAGHRQYRARPAHAG
jgi:peptide/nickel transport system permease protein